MTTELYIQSVIDKALDFDATYLGGFKWPAELIPENMVDHTKVDPGDGMLFWSAGKASISPDTFLEYEQKIGHPLPESYKQFLGYKYFVELHFGHAANLFCHTPNWVEENVNEIMNDRDASEALEKGFIPFARNNDDGYFCFDTNQPVSDYDYKIATYDSSFEDQAYPSIRKGQFIFIDLVREMEQTLDDWKQRKMDNY